MPAILSTNAMIMVPAKMMDLASVILDSSAMTVQVKSQSSFEIENWQWQLALKQIGSVMVDKKPSNKIYK